MWLLTRVVALCLLLVVAGACTRDGSGAGDPRPSAGSSEGPELRAAALRLVEARDEALRTGDRDAFLATVDPAAEDFLATQERWFDNLARLPLAEVSLAPGDEDMMTRVAAKGAVQVPVELTLRLRGFDRRASTHPGVYTFARHGDDVLLTDDRNIQSDALTGWLPAPWDVTTIDVRRSGTVLGVFDEETSATAASTMAELAVARRVVLQQVPAWDGRVVAYSIANVDALDRMSAMDVRRTAGVAFPVPVRPGSRQVAGMRLALNPSASATAEDRARTITHEVAHVALGRDDDRSPAWLVEGSAEHVARLGFPAARVAAHYRSFAASRGSLPLEEVGADFYQRRPLVHYESAALVCSYLAATRGTSTLWSLMRAFARARVVSVAEVDEVLLAEVGVPTRRLAADARAWALAG